MGTTAKMGLPYPSASDAPDGPGAIYALAQAIEAQLGNTPLGSLATLPSGSGFDTGTGFCDVISFGGLRVVHFSIFSSTGFNSSTPFMTMNAGHRPAGVIWSGGVVYDAGPSEIASLSMEPDGNCYARAWNPDNLNDGRVSGARGTFTYFAAN